MPRKTKIARPDTSTVTTENEQHMENPGTVSGKKKASKNVNVSVRRSGRLRNRAPHTPNKEKVVEEIDLVDGEGQDEPNFEELSNEPKEPYVDESNEPKEPYVDESNEPKEPHVDELSNEPHIEEVSNEPNEPQVEELSKEPLFCQQVLVEKIDYLVQSVKEVKEFNSKAAKSTFSGETQVTEFNYKSLYIDSQKKIDALVTENHQLAKKLEFALGKIEAYEQMKDFIGNLKDMMLLSSLGKTTEAVINFSSQAGNTMRQLPAAVGSPAAANDDAAKASPGKAKGSRKKAAPQKEKVSRKKSKRY